MSDAFVLPPPPPPKGIWPPLPSMPPPAPPPPPDVPDPKSWLDGVAANHPALEPWRKQQTGASASRQPPTAPRPARPPGFEHQKTTVDRATEMVGTGSPLQMAGGVLQILMPGFSGMVNNYYASKINLWQENFLRNHGDTLRMMSDVMQRVVWSVDGIRPLLRQPLCAHRSLDRILEEKRKMGDDLLEEIGNRVRETTDPDERARLEDLYKKTQQWVRERDARVNAEQPRVRDLQRRMDQLGDVAKDLDRSFDQASREAWKMVSYENNALHHARPESGRFAYDLQDFLLGARQRVDDALRGT